MQIRRFAAEISLSALQRGFSCGGKGAYDMYTDAYFLSFWVNIIKNYLRSRENENLRFLMKNCLSMKNIFFHISFFLKKKLIAAETSISQF